MRFFGASPPLARLLGTGLLCLTGTGTLTGLGCYADGQESTTAPESRPIWTVQRERL